ncbi:hypothetical protein [Phaffia rhodozyma]|uniref:Uncharacterized protein n=1 Tax=Phaffia rhodozyma TaxID=264483 RepID=A0A0F7SF43_PHARH|nr:hypothetical protein [Phaffia rhodozyma]
MFLSSRPLTLVPPSGQGRTNSFSPVNLGALSGLDKLRSLKLTARHRSKRFQDIITFFSPIIFDPADFNASESQRSSLSFVRSILNAYLVSWTCIY